MNIIVFRYMLGAVSAHKLVIAFCIGVELISNRTKTWLSVVYITTFAIVSPLGIGIGLILVGGEGATAAGVYSVVLQGLASGTLLYVIFFEIWKSDRTGIIQYIAALFGFGLMFGLQLLSKFYRLLRSLYVHFLKIFYTITHFINLLH